MILTDWVRNGPLVEVWKDTELVAVFTDKDVAEMSNALARQEGGDHYTKLKIQPMEYSMANGLDACQHTAIKYLTRFREKGGRQDLEKAIHTIQMLIEFEYGDKE